MSHKKKQEPPWRCSITCIPCLKKTRTDACTIFLVYNYPQKNVVAHACRWPQEAVPAWAHPESSDYLHERGISSEEIRQYQLAYAPTGYWHHRLLIPMYDHETLVSFQGRSLDGREPRYQTSGPRILYCPFPQAVTDHLLLVEGPFDVYAVARVYQAVAATLGNIMSQQQQEMLHRWFPNLTHVSVLYDREAITAAYDVQLRLTPLIPTDVCEISEKDPGEMASCQIRQLLETQISVTSHRR